MTHEQMFQLLRECVAFGSAQSPYVLTDSQEIALNGYLHTLEELVLETSTLIERLEER